MRSVKARKEDADIDCERLELERAAKSAGGIGLNPPEMTGFGVEFVLALVLALVLGALPFNDCRLREVLA